MSNTKAKHPVIVAIAYTCIVGGFITLFLGLILAYITLEQQNWPSSSTFEREGGLTYRVGEQSFPVKTTTESANTIEIVYFDPQAPEQHIIEQANYWWYLYLSMTGLIVLYAGLHLKREKNRDIQSLGFE